MLAHTAHRPVKVVAQTRSAVAARGLNMSVEVLPAEPPLLSSPSPIYLRSTSKEHR